MPDQWQVSNTLGAVSHHLNAKKAQSGSSDAHNKKHFRWWARFYGVVKRYRLLTAVYVEMVSCGLLSDEDESGASDEKRNTDEDNDEDYGFVNATTSPTPSSRKAITRRKSSSGSPASSSPLCPMPAIRNIDDAIRRFDDEKKEQARGDQEEAESLQ